MSLKQFSLSAVLVTGLLAGASSFALAQTDNQAATTAAANHTDSGDKPTAAQPAKGVSQPASAEPATAASAPAKEGSEAAQGEHHVTGNAAPADTTGATGDTATKSSTENGAPAAASNSNAAAQTPNGGAGTVGQSVPSTGNGQPAGASTGSAANTGASPTATPGPAATAAGSTAGQPASAGTPAESELIHQSWAFDGPFGTYDRAQLQRGFQVYKQVCSACHSMNLLSYRNLEDIGYTEGQVKAIAQDYQVNDGPIDEGEMFQRAAKPADRFHAPFPNKKAAAAANNGAAPPDMSLLVKAREGGPDYIYGILTGYADPPAGTTLQPNQYWNKAMHGHIIAMPPPLHDGAVTYDNAAGIPNTTAQYATDVAAFLQWTSEPHQDDRKRTGVKAFLFLAIFAAFVAAAKKKIWRKLH